MQKKVSRASAKKDEKPKVVFDSGNKHLDKKSVSIVFFYHDEPDEMIPDHEVGINSDNEIDLPRLVESLKINSFLREDCSISYLSLAPEHHDEEFYIYCGDTSKLQESTNIPASAINKDNQVNTQLTQLKLKIRKNKRPLVENLLEEQKKNAERETADEKGAKQKEKKIGEVVEKVALWRRFYTGFYDEKGTFIQKPLESAATEVGIAKKTLDDYLLQIRQGKKFGFNFNEHVNGKIGELRAFVRDAKKQEKNQKE